MNLNKLREGFYKLVYAQGNFNSWRNLIYLFLHFLSLS